MLVFFLVSASLKSNFTTFYNINNLLILILPLMLIGIGQTLVVLTGGIDLSVGSVISVSNVVCATLMTQTTSGCLKAIIISLLAGVTIGMLNGLIITKTRIAPLIVTLAMSSIAEGFALLVLDRPGGTVHFQFAAFFRALTLGIPNAVLLIIVFMAILWVLLNRTQFGQSLFAIGGNEGNAYSCGIAVERTKTIAYVVSALLASLAGIILATQMYSGDPTVGSAYTTKSLIITALGGTSLMGGKGSISGCFAGAAILAIINNILNLLGISTYYQFVIQGLILVAALLFGILRNRYVKH